MSSPFTSLVQALPASVPFTGPETIERQLGAPFKARIGANESAFGISPLAKQALHEHINTTGCSWYGDPENFALRQLLAQKHQIEMDNIVVDAGIDALLGLIVRMTVEPGMPVVSSLGAYPTFNYHVAGFGGKLHTVPYREQYEDPLALLERAGQVGARLLYLSNPDNPMGSCLSAQTLQDLIEQLPTGCILLLDEAYVEFMSEFEPPTLDVSNPQVIRFRTFSKAYGMAGMRIGYAMGDASLIAGFDRVRNHFSTNRLAQIAAEASLHDTQILPMVLEKVSAGRQRIYDLADQLQLPYLHSSTNFVALDIGCSTKANRLLNDLTQHGIFIRKPMITPNDTYIRVGVGTPHEHELFAQAFKELLKHLN